MCCYEINCYQYLQKPRISKKFSVAKMAEIFISPKGFLLSLQAALRVSTKVEDKYEAMSMLQILKMV